MINHQTRLQMQTVGFLSGENNHLLTPSMTRLLLRWRFQAINRKVPRLLRQVLPYVCLLGDSDQTSSPLVLSCHLQGCPPTWWTLSSINNLPHHHLRLYRQLDNLSISTLATTTQ